MPIGKAQSKLERLSLKGCRVPLYVKSSRCAPKDVLLNYERVWAYYGARIEAHAEGTLAHGHSDEFATSVQAMTFTADYVTRIYELSYRLESISATMPLRDIHGLSVESCAGNCGTLGGPCDTLVTVANAGAGLIADVFLSADGGRTWTPTTAQPFGTNEHIVGVEVIWPTNEVRRIIVGRGTTDASAHAEIAYSDDDGATWTPVSLGTANGDYITHHAALYALDELNLWCGLESGEIHYSDDGGISWVKQSSATTEPIRGIHFANEKVGVAVGGEPGVSVVLQYTTDGGQVWAAVTTYPAGGTVAIHVVACFGLNEWMVGLEDGTLALTRNMGRTWVIRQLVKGPTQTAYQDVYDLRIINRLVLWVANGWESNRFNYGSVQRSFNGGYDWEMFATDVLDNALYGVQAVFPCGPNLAHAVGNTATTATVVTVGHQI